ncbi:MAG: hypothetical protein Q9160_008466 [Pyrenula sp. 1 TL-2023]
MPRAGSMAETFLPFDLEAAFAATMVLFLIPVIDNSLIENRASWAETAYDVLDEMILCGNRNAAARKSDLQQLEAIMAQISYSSPNRQATVRTQDARPNSGGHVNGGQPFNVAGFSASRVDLRQLQPLDEMMEQSTFSQVSMADQLFMQTPSEPLQENIWNDGYTAEQLLMVANSLDLDGLDWMMTGSSTTAD